MAGFLLQAGTLAAFRIVEEPLEWSKLTPPPCLACKTADIICQGLAPPQAIERPSA